MLEKNWKSIKIVTVVLYFLILIFLNDLSLKMSSIFQTLKMTNYILGISLFAFFIFIQRFIFGVILAFLNIERKPCFKFTPFYFIFGMVLLACFLLYFLSSFIPGFHITYQHWEDIVFIVIPIFIGLFIFKGFFAEK